MEKVAEDYEGLKRQYLALRSIVNAKERTLAKANERVRELEGQLQLTMLTTHEASFESDYGKKRLNKFAIEKKIEALEGFRSEFDAQNDYWGNSPMAYVGDLDKVIEQLRKEKV